MRKFFKLLLPLLIVAAGAFIALTLVRTRPQAARVAPVAVPALVEVLEVRPTTERAVVDGMGTVLAAQQVSIFPEVAGRVVYQNPKLVPGGRFEAGELLIRLDPRDYELAVAQQVSNVERADFELKVEKSRTIVAEREWSSLGEEPPAGADTIGREVALRGPHLRNAVAALDAAKSGLERARLNVERTRIRAPFNGFVQEESIDIGQIVTPQTKLGTLVGTDELWVQVSVPLDRLAWVAIPGVNADQGSTVRIVQETDGISLTRTGGIVRLMGDVDPMGRMARLLVAVKDPLGLSLPLAERGLPLLVGAYVRVEIDGSELERVFVIPRAALHERDRVFVADASSKLAIKTVDVVYRREANVVVRSGLQAGDRVITSRLPVVQEGMTLRVREPTMTRGVEESPEFQRTSAEVGE